MRFRLMFEISVSCFLSVDPGLAHNLMLGRITFSLRHTSLVEWAKMLPPVRGRGEGIFSFVSHVDLR